MKKQIFNLSIIGILLLTLFSCENLFSPKQDIPTNVIQTPTLQTNVATVKISSKMPRTVLPEAFTENTQGLTWKLTVSGESGTCYTEEWTDTEDGSNTAYQNMLADSFTLATGTYKFSLSVDRVGNDGKRVLYSIIESQEIKLGTNVLNFEMKEATGDSAAPGSIDFTLNFPANVVSKAIATLHKWNSSENDFETQNPSDTNEILASNTNQSFLSSVNYTKENIPLGTYLLKIQLQKSKVTTQGFETINTYSCIVRVAPGLCSKGEYTLKSLNYGQLFNLSFKLNEGNFGSGSSTSMTYNAYECIDLPKPTKEGYDFDGWYTDEALQTPVQLESDNKYRITQDITLYAKWEKNLSFNYSFILKDKDGSPVSTGASYSVDSDKFATIKVFNPNDSDEVWSYLIESNDENVSFTEGYNYTISVDLKASAQTVVAIAAAEADMFFTVGNEWKTYTFETGYLKADSENGISIGTGLSNEVCVSNLVITKSTVSSSLPALSFYIDKDGITSYLDGNNYAEDIIKVEKTTESTNNNSGYKLTLNSTGVTLQLRDYISQRTLGLYKASFDMKSDNSDLKTSIVAKTTNSEQFAKTWNTPTAIGTDTKTCNVFVPVYTANEEYIIDGILSEGQTAGDVIEISNYKIENITTLDNTGKVFAIKTDNTWNQSTTLPFTQQVIILGNAECVYDVLLMNSFATVPNDESDWNECIRFLNTSEDTDNFTFTFTSENNNTTYKIENQTEEELTLNITLTADCKVVIEEVESSVIELTNNWLASHVNSSDQWHCYSLPAGNYCVKEDITLYYPIVIEENGCNTQIYADGNYSITCQTSLPYYGTNTTMITLKSGNTLTLGGGTGKLTLDGNAVSNMTTLISVNGGSILNLKDNCTITNGNVIDGAVYVRSGCIFNMSGGTITGNSNTNTDGNCAGVKVSGGTFTMTAGTISNNWVNGINHGASIQINDGTVNLPNTPLTGGVFTYNIINGEVQYPSGGTTSTYSVGDVYPKDGTPIGVVFNVTNDYVYIIGLEEEQQQLCYGTRNCVTQIQENAPTTNNFNNEFDGCQNMTNWYSFITTNSVDFSSAEFPAFNYCLTYRDTEGEAGTWYLPAYQELSIIQSNIDNLNNTLRNQNATTLANSYSYWSSTYVAEGKASIMGMLSGSRSENSLDTPCYVRPCKRIKITNGSSDVLIKGLNVETAGEAISNIYTAGEHYIKLDSSVTAEQLETIKDAIEKNNKLTFDDTDPDESSTIYLDLSSTEIIELPADSLSELDTLTSVILPTSLERMDGSVFQYCKYLNKFVVSADNQYFKVDDGGEILLSKDGTELISWPYAYDDITIPDSVTKIADYALSMSYITSVDLNKVVEIGDFAFYYTDIKTLTIPGYVTKIGKYAFYSCENLTSVEFADTNGWSVVNDEDEKKSIEVTNSPVNNLIYASDDDIPGYADYTWIKDSSSTSGGGIANYTDTAGISISDTQYAKTSLVTVISQKTRIDCSDEGFGVFTLYYDGSVTLSPFAMGQYEVTQELYQAVMTKKPSGFKEDTLASGETQNLRPVDSVNWYQAVAFCNELTIQTMGKPYCVYYTDSSCSTVYTTNDAYNETLPYFDQSQKGYRLPTEAEWEFAARGGDETQDDWTWDIPGNSGNSSNVYSNYAWFVDNSDTITHQVGKKTPNRLDLYDMAGNVQEWCWDYYEENFIPENLEVTDPTGYESDSSNSYRAARGGYWESAHTYCSVTSRDGFDPATTKEWTLNTLGFRICRSL